MFFFIAFPSLYVSVFISHCSTSPCVCCFMTACANTRTVMAAVMMMSVCTASYGAAAWFDEPRAVWGAREHPVTPFPPSLSAVGSVDVNGFLPLRSRPRLTGCHFHHGSSSFVFQTHLIISLCLAFSITVKCLFRHTLEMRASILFLDCEEHHHPGGPWRAEAVSAMLL